MSTEQPRPTAGTEFSSTDPVDQVIRYHIQTKHHFNRYARSIGFLDWANQPDPFRRFAGAELIPLPLLKPDGEPVSPAYEAIYQPGMVACQRVTVRTLSRFFDKLLLKKIKWQGNIVQGWIKDELSLIGNECVFVFYENILDN